MVCICNEADSTKMYQWKRNVFHIPFDRPTVQQIFGRIKSITNPFKEAIDIEDAALRELIESCNRDLRQVRKRERKDQ